MNIVHIYLFEKSCCVTLFVLNLSLGCDSKAIINLLCARTNAQRLQIELEYKTMYGRVRLQVCCISLLWFTGWPWSRELPRSFDPAFKHVSLSLCSFYSFLAQEKSDIQSEWKFSCWCRQIWHCFLGLFKTFQQPVRDTDYSHVPRVGIELHLAPRLVCYQPSERAILGDYRL